MSSVVVPKSESNVLLIVVGIVIVVVLLYAVMKPRAAATKKSLPTAGSPPPSTSAAKGVTATGGATGGMTGGAMGGMTGRPAHPGMVANIEIQIRHLTQTIDQLQALLEGVSVSASAYPVEKFAGMGHCPFPVGGMEYDNPTAAQIRLRQLEEYAQCVKNSKPQVGEICPSPMQDEMVMNDLASQADRVTMRTNSKLKDYEACLVSASH